MLVTLLTNQEDSLAAWLSILRQTDVLLPDFIGLL